MSKSDTMFEARNTLMDIIRCHWKVYHAFMASKILCHEWGAGLSGLVPWARNDADSVAGWAIPKVWFRRGLIKWISGASSPSGTACTLGFTNLRLIVRYMPMKILGIAYTCLSKPSEENISLLCDGPVSWNMSEPMA